MENREAIRVKKDELPKLLILETPDGEEKEYSIEYGRKAHGIKLTKND